MRRHCHANEDARERVREEGVPQVSSSCSCSKLFWMDTDSAGTVLVLKRYVATESVHRWHLRRTGHLISTGWTSAHGKIILHYAVR